MSALQRLFDSFDQTVEAIFVVAGYSDKSYELLKARLPTFPHPTQLIRHSRNFGSFQAVRAGMAAARGDYMAAVAADLQELVANFFVILGADQADVTFGVREHRADPWLSRLFSNAFGACTSGS